MNKLPYHIIGEKGIMGFLCDNDVANFLVDRRNKVYLQSSIDKRARKKMHKILKWNKLLDNNLYEIKTKLSFTNCKNIGELFDLSQRRLIVLKYSYEISIINYLYNQLDMALELNNADIVENILKDKHKILWHNACIRPYIRPYITRNWADLSSDDENDDFKDPIKSVVNRLLTQLIEKKMENTQMYNTLLEHWIDMNKDVEHIEQYLQT